MIHMICTETSRCRFKQVDYVTKMLIITVADKGAGYTAGPHDAATGFGLQQVRERLHTLYGVRADFFIHAAPGGGTIATVRIPFQA